MTTTPSKNRTVTATRTFKICCGVACFVAGYVLTAAYAIGLS